MKAVHLKLGSLAVALVLGGALVGACGGDEGGNPAPTVAVKTSAAASPAGGATTGQAGDAREIVVTMTENKFDPATISVSSGQPITFVAKNAGSAVHDMKVLTAATEGKDYSSEPLVSPGKESKFTVTFTKKGTVHFQCDYHMPDMAGTIEVK